MSNIIECQSVSKRFGNKYAIDHLNLSLPSGKVIGILGENGAGKSTLFRLLTGLSSPEEGSIKILGQKPGYNTNAKIAYLPDRARWYTDHKVNDAFVWGENFLPGFVRQDADRLLSLMNIDIEMDVSGMSRGQEARLMLIMCLARDVPLIILDEPFSGIDTVSREKIVEGLIDYISDRQQTILISTHEIYEVEGLLDYVVYLEDGKIRLAEDSDQIRKTYGAIHCLPKKLMK